MRLVVQTSDAAAFTAWKNIIMPNSHQRYNLTSSTTFVDDRLDRAVQAAVHGLKTPRQAQDDANAACQAQLDTVLHG